MRCQPCGQGACEDCKTLGFGCECCGPWDDDDDEEDE